MEKGTVGVTVVVGDTPNERLLIEASSRGTVALSISYDAIVIVHRMFLTTPSLHPPLRANRLSNGCALRWTDACVRICEQFRGCRLGERCGGYPIG
jgi:hypothetical protein